MAGQPLAWMEASNLPDEAFAIKPLVDAYRSVQHDLHSGTILPIGDEPSGRSWTGFQSITSPDSGYLLIYREDTPGAKGVIETWLPEGSVVTLDPVLGHGKKMKLTAGRKGCLNITLDSPNDFAMYKYTVKK